MASNEIGRRARALADHVYFSGQPLTTHSFTVLKLLARLRPAPVGVEVGVAYGDFSLHLLAYCPGLHLHMIDPYLAAAPGSAWRLSGDPAGNCPQHVFDDMAATAEWVTGFAADRRTIHRRADGEVVHEYPDGAFDFVYIDSDHTHAAVRRTIRDWWPKVAPGGFIGGHDHGNLDFEDPATGRCRWGVIRAVAEFAAGVGLAAETTPAPSMTWAVFKPA